MADHVGLGQRGDKRGINDTLIAREQGPPEHLCRRENDPVSWVAMEPDGKRRDRCRHRRSDAETLNQRGRRGRFQPLPQGKLHSRGSWSNGARNADPLQAIVFVVSPATPWRLPLWAQCPWQSMRKKITFTGKIQH
jgi:hypothetical protein